MAYAWKNAQNKGGGGKQGSSGVLSGFTPASTSSSGGGKDKKDKDGDSAMSDVGSSEED